MASYETPDIRLAVIHANLHYLRPVCGLSLSRTDSAVGLEGSEEYQSFFQYQASAPFGNGGFHRHRRADPRSNDYDRMPLSLTVSKTNRSIEAFGGMLGHKTLNVVV